MSRIRENIQHIKKTLPDNVLLVAVSKFNPAASVMEAYAAGQRVFGESKVQELVQKYESLPKDIKWHFIGHLQTNKVKYIVPFIDLIHGIDSFKLLREINKWGEKYDKTIRCLLQIHIAKEDTKFGFSPEECMQMLEQENWRSLHNVSICGLMGMASFTNNTSLIRTEFSSLKHLFEQLKNTYFADKPDFSELSMGMSEDCTIAIEEGSTMVRIGSTIFGARNYTA